MAVKFLKVSTATFIQFGPVLASNGWSTNISLALTSADIYVAKNGASFANLNDNSAIAYDAVGHYRVPLNGTDTGSVGRLRVAMYKAGALPIWDDWAVVPANVFDSLSAGSDYLQVDAAQVEGADATDTIRDAVVDDATRIDASALNTLSGHDPGEAIAGATDTMAANITQIGGVVQSLTDFKDLVDTGYDPTAHTIASNLTSILGTLLTETAGYLAAGFKKFFNVLNPTGTLLSIPDALPGANNGLPTTNGTKVNQTVDLTAGQTIGANLVSILGTALTETGGYLAAGFKKFFNVLNPTGTLLSIPDALPGANNGLPTTNGSKVNQTVDLTAGQTIGANVTQIGGVVQSLTDFKDMVDTGYDPTAHTMASNLTSILGTLLTETAGYLAAGFKKFFNVLNPTGTLLSIPDAAPGANGGLPTTNGSKLNQTVDLTAGQTVAANITQIGGVVQSLTDLKDLVDTGYDPVTHKFAGVVLTDSVTGMALEASLTAIKGVGWTIQTLKKISDDILALGGATTWDELLAAHENAGSMGLAIKNILGNAIGKQEVSLAAKTLTIYNTDGTVAKVFNLVDAAGAPTTTSPYARVPV